MNEAALRFHLPSKHTVSSPGGFTVIHTLLKVETGGQKDPNDPHVSEQVGQRFAWDLDDSEDGPTSVSKLKPTGQQ